MKYRCLGPFKFEGKVYNYDDVISSNKELDLPGVLVIIDNTVEEIPKIEVKEEKKPTPKPKKR